MVNIVTPSDELLVKLLKAKHAYSVSDAMGDAYRMRRLDILEELGNPTVQTQIVVDDECLATITVNPRRYTSVAQIEQALGKAKAKSLVAVKQVVSLTRVHEGSIEKALRNRGVETEMSSW